MNLPDRFLLHGLADLVDYPGPSCDHVFAECRRLGVRLPAPAQADLVAFVDWAEALTANELEESYAATFDSSDSCALEVGWHLYGEAYQRGVFLVEMRGRLRERAIDEGHELPDHLSHVLRWIAEAQRDDERTAERVVRLAVAPALGAIVRGLAAKSSGWLPLLRAILCALDPEGRAVAASAPRARPAQSFTGGCA